MSRETLSWRVSRRDGTFDDPVTIDVDVDTADYLRDLWEQIKRMPVGRDRSGRVNELRVQLDLLACGAVPVLPVSRSDKPIPPPPYLQPASNEFPSGY